MDRVELYDGIPHEDIEVCHHPCTVTPVSNALTQEHMYVTMHRIEQLGCLPKVVHPPTRDNFPKPSIGHMGWVVHKEVV